MRREIQLLDPILIGDSGQIKEFREETVYASIGLPDHRHISHLCALYPGTLIDDGNPDWQAAASKTLDLRGNDTRNWAMAHRMNARARLGEAEKAYEVYQKFIAERTFPNLLTWQPPFQVDGTFGSLAGVVEMLLQSHNGVINLLPALPDAWDTGSFSGLVARGNFVVDIDWKNGKANKVAITSRAGRECQIRYPGIDSASIKDPDGKEIEISEKESDQVVFDTIKGTTYTITFP